MKRPAPDSQRVDIEHRYASSSDLSTVVPSPSPGCAAALARSGEQACAPGREFPQRDVSGEPGTGRRRFRNMQCRRLRHTGEPGAAWALLLGRPEEDTQGSLALVAIGGSVGRATGIEPT